MRAINAVVAGVFNRRTRTRTRTFCAQLVPATSTHWLRMSTRAPTSMPATRYVCCLCVITSRVLSG